LRLEAEERLAVKHREREALRAVVFFVAAEAATYKPPRAGLRLPASLRPTLSKRRSDLQKIAIFSATC